MPSPGKPPEGFPQLEGLFSGAFQVSSSSRQFDGSESNAVAIRVLNDTPGKYLSAFILYQAEFTLDPITVVLYTPGQVFALEKKEIGEGKAGDFIFLKAVYDVEVVYANERKLIR